MSPARSTLERIALGLYPREFRRLYEAELLASMRDSFAELPSMNWPWRMFRMVVLAGDVVFAALLEHATVARRRMARRGGGLTSGLRSVFQWLNRTTRHSVRTLSRTPLYTVVALATLMLGIGSGASIFAVVYAVLLKPLPYPTPSSIVTIWEQDLEEGPERKRVAPPNFHHWDTDANSLAHVAAVVGESFVLDFDGVPTNVLGRRVTPDFFNVFRVRPELGRGFLPTDIEPGAEPVMVISHGFWQRRFGGDSSAVASTLETDGTRRRVVGVLPPTFEYGGGRDLWIPLGIPDEEFDNSYLGARYLTVVGRLTDGATVWQAQQELARMIRDARGEGSERRWGTVVQPLHDTMVGDVDGYLWLILGAVGVVIVVVSANLTNLGIARGTSRATEVAVRMSLGASRGRVFAESLVESFLLCGVGAIGGLVVAAWATKPLVALAPVSIPRLDQTAITGEVVAAVLVLTAVTGLLMSLATGSNGDYANPAGPLRGDRSVTSGKQGLRSALIVGEIALSVTLLVASGLITRSFLKMREVDPGFSPSGVTTTALFLPDTRYPTKESKLAVYNNVLAAVQALPQFQASGFTTNLPMAGSNMNFGFKLESEEDEARGNRVAEFHTVSHGYFRAMGIPVMRGTVFSAGDIRGEYGPIVINQALADRYFPGRDPIDQKLRIFTDEGYTWRTIIGVVGNVLHGGPAEPPREEVYVPMSDLIWTFNNLAVRSNLAPERVTEIVRNAVQSIEPGLAVDPVTPFEDYVDKFLAPLRFQTTLFGLFALSAVVLSAVGLYGLIAYLVGARRREFGIRIALGARSRTVLLLVMRHGLGLTAVGVLLGAAVAVTASRLIGGMLFEVGRFDALVIVTALTGTVLVTIVATLVPSFRATRVDPVEALSAE